MDVLDVQTFIGCLEDAIVVIDENLRVVLANAAALRGCGWTAEQVINQPCYARLHGQSAPCDDPPFGICAMQTVWATGQPVCVRHHHLHADGCVHVVEICASALPKSESGGMLVVEVMRDITRQTELEMETAQRHRELSVLNQITSAIARSLDLEALARELLDLLSAALEAEWGAIYQSNGGRTTLVAGKGAELPPAMVSALDAALRQGLGPLILPDIYGDPQWARLAPPPRSTRMS